MKKTNPFLVCLLLLFACSWQVNAQSRSALEDEAYEHLNNFDFARAFDAFSKLHTRYPKEMDYHFKMGICALGYPEKKDKAIDIFKEIVLSNKTREAQYYLARAYHANYRFDEAIAVLQPLIDQLTPSKKKDDKAALEDAKIIMNNCINGKVLMANRMSNSDVKNIGAPINTREIEGVPIITADESMMIFTYVGKKSMGGKLNAMLEPDQNGTYLSDIYMSMRSADSTWKVPTPITALNTKANDAAIALSPDGHTLFTFLSNNENEGDIFVSTYNGSEFTKPEPLNKNVNHPDYWEGSCSISADGKYLYFASERPNGYGGRDIWMSEFINGDWGPAVNLGPKINTALDDDAPFIHPDGVTLFFSSKGHTSIGGYDIMYSSKEGDEWGTPTNMGIPLNTTEDDRYYVINSKGDKGYFSSDRATADAKGGQDIYMVTPGIVGEKLIVGLFKGVVYGDNKPVEARIEVSKSTGGEQLGPFLTNRLTGKYLLTFKPGAVYKLKIIADGFDSKEEELDLETMNSYVERTRDYYLYSKAFAAANPSEVKVDTAKRYVAPLTTAPEPVKVASTPTPEPTPEPVAVKTTEPKTEPVKTTEPAKATETLVAVAEPVKTKAEEPVKTKPSEPVKKTKTKDKEVVAVKEKVTEPTKEEVATAAPCNPKVPVVASIKGKSLNDVTVYKEMLELAGDYCDQNIVYKVQIGAYRKPENFKYPNLKTLGAVETVNYPDGITRFTQKQFNTIRDAEKHRQKAITKGQNDAWIVAFVNGVRYPLEDLINQDFLAKPVN